MEATASKSVKNYFDSLQKFSSAWFETLESGMKPGLGSSFQHMRVDMYRKKLDAYLKSLQEYAQKEADDLDKLSPEEFQKQTLDSFKKFEAWFNDAAKKTGEALKKQEEYINSKDFVKDAQENARMSSRFYGSFLDSLSKVLDGMTENLKKT